MTRKTNSTNYINQSFLEEKCALNELIHFLSKRWTTEVLFSIEDGNVRFSEIKKDLQHISDQVLAARLKSLENYGLIGRTPPANGRTVYQLTGKGRELSTLLGRLCAFAEENTLYVPLKMREHMPPAC